MSFSEIDQVRLARAIAEAGCNIPLNGSRSLDADGVCDVLRRLAASRDEYAAQARIAAAECEQESWRRQCAEKDVAREKERLATMTEYRDNGIKRVKMAECERDAERARGDEARAELAALKKRTRTNAPRAK